MFPQLLRRFPEAPGLEIIGFKGEKERLVGPKNVIFLNRPGPIPIDRGPK